MDTVEIPSDGEENLILSTQWDPDEWILAGRKYHDVPAFVDIARSNLLKIPDHFAQKLPSKSMSISGLLRYDLPPRSDGVDSMDIDSNLFTTQNPTTDIEDTLPFLALPTRTLLNQLVSMSGQAWFDGHKSIRTWLNPEIAFPFWALTYWGEMLNACESKDAWPPAEIWVDRTGKSEEERIMNLTVRGLWNGLGWHGQLPGFGGIEIIRLAALFSTEYQGSEIVDALVALLSFRLRLSEDLPSGNTILVDTTFASVVWTLLPIVDGVATGPITSNSSGQKHLKKYGAREEKMGVQTYRASGTYANHKTGVVKVLTDRQRLAQAMHAIVVVSATSPLRSTTCIPILCAAIPQDLRSSSTTQPDPHVSIVKRGYQQGSSAGLNRSIRRKTDSSALPGVKTGNAANAVVTAAGRAKETIKRQRTIFAKLKSLSTVAEASVGSSRRFEPGSHGFAICGPQIVLARVITMYSKNGGKAGAHSLAHSCESIGALSYFFVQTYEHSYRRQFKNTRRADLPLGAIE
ncbi:hypothetical protein DFH09DRAFT_1361160 [Mycena vulgaris]|nr:hypothetical protein DFH09DRAFT_1361160 [Mycena vulgaris]